MPKNIEENPAKSFFSKTAFILKKAGLDGFLLMLAAMIGLAYFFPAPGLATEPISLEQLTNYGLSLVFFFYGLRLSFAELRHGLGNWRLHLAVQLTTFLFFPLVVLLFKPFAGEEFSRLLWLGTFYLAVLPSTVSSSVVMVSTAGGNIPAAIFNAAVSAVSGIFITPLWMSLFLATSGENFDTAGIIAKLALQVLLPFTLGILLNKKFGAFAGRHKKLLRYFDQTVILLIVYTAFCKSFTLGIFQKTGAADIVWLIFLMTALFFTSYGFILLAAKFLKFDLPDTVTLLFCGSKKSLVHGSMMSKVLFQDSPATGILLLPLMVFHALQIMFASIIARKIAERTGNADAGE